VINPPDHTPLTDEQIRAGIIGELTPHAGSILLVAYDESWPRLYGREEERIRAALGNRALQVEHVGSTSVPRLAAKPIIDIVLVVADSADEPAYVPDLEAAGYVLRILEPDWFEHRLFKGPDTNVSVHALSRGCSEIQAMVDFRDWLRANDSDRGLYEQTKRDLAAQDWKYVQNYADAKSAVVAEINTRARRSEAHARSADDPKGSVLDLVVRQQDEARGVAERHKRVLARDPRDTPVEPSVDECRHHALGYPTRASRLVDDEHAPGRPRRREHVVDGKRCEPAQVHYARGHPSRSEAARDTERHVEPVRPRHEGEVGPIEVGARGAQRHVRVVQRSAPRVVAVLVQVACVVQGNRFEEDTDAAVDRR